MKPALPRLVVITDFSRGEPALLAALDAALAGGEGLAVQHRQPGATARQCFTMAETLKVLCARHRAQLFVSARLDFALALGCHLHLPAWALPPSAVRAALPEDFLISTSVHDSVEAAGAAGADLALVSPVWPAGSKPSDDRSPLGPDGFAALSARLQCPAFALGGVTPARLAALNTARGAASISRVLWSADPRTAARDLLAALP